MGRMRNFILGAIVVLLIFGISQCDDQYERAEKKSMKVLEKFSNAYEHGDLISRGTHPEKVIRDIDEKLGKYMTEEFFDKISRKLEGEMKGKRDFSVKPMTLSFFLTNTGDGFRFSAFEVDKHKIWLTKNDKVVGSEIYVHPHPDNPRNLDDSNENLPFKTITMMKSGWTYKVDAVD